MVSMLRCPSSLGSVLQMAKIPASQYSVIACFVALGSDGSACIVAAGIGTRCLGPSLLRADRATVADCHAEVLARKALCRLIALECLWLSSQRGPAAPTRAAIVELEAGTRRPVQRPDVRIVLWISESPCGDASVGIPPKQTTPGHPAKRVRKQASLVPPEVAALPAAATQGSRAAESWASDQSWGAAHWSGAKPASWAATAAELEAQETVLASRCLASSEPDPSSAHVDPPTTDGEGNEQAQGLLRVKSGRSDLPHRLRTRSMSCSDKIARWHLTGLQGFSLASAVSSIRLHGIVVSADRGSNDPAAHAGAEDSAVASSLPVTAAAVDSSASPTDGSSIRTVPRAHLQVLRALHRAVNHRCDAALAAVTTTTSGSTLRTGLEITSTEPGGGHVLTTATAPAAHEAMPSVLLAATTWRPPETRRACASSAESPPSKRAAVVTATTDSPAPVCRSGSWGSAFACIGLQDWPAALAHAAVANSPPALATALRWSLQDILALPCPREPVGPPVVRLAAPGTPLTLPVATVRRAEVISARGLLLGRKSDTPAEAAAPAVAPCRLEPLLRAACAAGPKATDAAASDDNAASTLQPDRLWAMMTGTLAAPGASAVNKVTGFERWLHCPWIPPDNDASP